MNKHHPKFLVVGLILLINAESKAQSNNPKYELGFALSSFIYQGDIND